MEKTDEKLTLLFYDLVEADIKAARLLQVNKLYPHSLYYISQSLEKLTKAHLLRRRLATFEFIRDKIKHNIYHALLLDAQANKTLYEKYKENIEKNALYATPDFKVFTKKEAEDEIKKWEKAVVYLTDMKDKYWKIKTTHSQKNPYECAEELNKHNSELIDMLKKIEDNKPRVSKLITTLSGTQSEIEKKTIKLQIDILNLNSKLMLILAVSIYEIHIIRTMWFVLPKQDSLRYPEFDPLGTYNSEHPLVKNIEPLILSIEKAIELWKIHKIFNTI